MGNEQSLSREDVHNIAAFSQKDIGRLYNRFRALDEDGNGQLDPNEILGVAELTENPLVQRVISVFDKDGYISNGDLYNVMKMMVGDNLEEVQLQQLIDRQMVIADQDGDGKLSFEEFKGAVQNIGVAEQLSIDLQG
eukprot:TRINITY_DN1945_c1_g1_i1.p1 TRINITY_DN1945_c1_g1~~TRINITY_DN1945_c1_g1_i1.p1  ORF type:complete len:137 (-),score=48.39 TRINITY_DN1945_c1_g1_i1:193-603(-)